MPMSTAAEACNNRHCVPEVKDETWWNFGCTRGCTDKKIDGISVCDCRNFWNCFYDAKTQMCICKLQRLCTCMHNFNVLLYG